MISRKEHDDALWAYFDAMVSDPDPPLHPDTIEMGRLRSHLSTLQALARCPTITLAQLQAVILATPLVGEDLPDAAP